METETCDVVEETFDNRFTRAFGFPEERIQTKVRDFLTEQLKAFISASPFLVMATSDPEGRCDASPKGGKPGFVRILDDHHLLVPDASGNKLFQSYQNMDANPHVGLIFFIPGIGEVARVNGRVSIVDRTQFDQHDVDAGTAHPAGHREVLQGIVIEVAEAYGHCPKAVTYGNIWDADQIARGKRSGLHPSRPATPSA
ncbi:MAG: uncharacterized protein QOF51_3538 [Chloroflexota bacterium]|nr:uncharacterized protein [Chloroflexota bacterium]